MVVTSKMLNLCGLPQNRYQTYLVILLFLIPLPICSAPLHRGGPNDYYDQSPAIRDILRSVNRAHVRPATEALERGVILYSTANKTGDVFHDLDYALRWFPNHPKALYDMSIFFIKYKKSYTNSGLVPPNVTADGYFEKAIKYRPNDAYVHSLYAVYLHKSGKLDEALKEYKIALKMLPNSSEVHYNLGLLYADKHEFKKALIYAKEAYKMGYPLPGLKNRLVKAGVWKNDVKTKHQMTKGKN